MKFKLTDEKIKFIADKFNTTVSSVTLMLTGYKRINEKMKDQYLAHIIRSLEEYVREYLSAPLFTITCKPQSSKKDLKSGCASYKKYINYTITYPSQLDEKQIRICIAHELGHLFLIIVNDKQPTEITEPLSSIFGIFAILDKNDFYANKTKAFQHGNWEDIVSDFMQLKNRKSGKLQIS